MERGLSNLGQIVFPDAHKLAYSNPPVQPDGRYRARAVNSFARLPVYAGEFSESAVRQIGCRAPSLDGFKTALRSGLWVKLF